MAIRIHRGDIFDIGADALVVPANVQPDLGWGSHIAERVRKRADPSVLAERQRFGQVALGEVCVTSGEGAGFPYLMHAAVLDKYDLNPLFLLRLKQRTSDRTLRNAVLNAQRSAAEFRLGSVAISAMGAGIGGMNYGKCCRLIFENLIGSDIVWIFAAYKPRHAAIAEEILKTGC